MFRAAEIIASADISEANLQKYLLALWRTRYLRIARPKQNGKSLGHTVWQIVDNTGPTCPIVRSDGVYDPNENRVRTYDPAQADDSKTEGRTDDDHGADDDDGRIELDHRVA